MDLSFQANVKSFDVIDREGVGLILRVVLASSDDEPRTSLQGINEEFAWPAKVEISFTMHEGEIAERLWSLRDTDGLSVRLHIEAPNGTL